VDDQVVRVGLGPPGGLGLAHLARVRRVVVALGRHPEQRCKA
jgi:hypothetical protein